jgi:thiol-disulfide isomerase/thioredoxin
VRVGMHYVSGFRLAAQLLRFVQLDDQRLPLRMRLGSILGTRRRLLLLGGAALSLVAIISVTSFVLFRNAPSDEASSCSSCGTSKTPLPEGEFILDEQRQRVLAESRRIVYQGLSVGESANPVIPSSEEASTWTLLYCYTLPEKGFQPERSFSILLLADWQEKFPGLRFHVILSGQIDSSMQGQIDEMLSSRISTSLDSDGSLRSQLRLEGTPPGFGFLLDPSGVVVARIPPLRIENAAYIEELLEAVAKRNAASSPPLARFPAIHPDQVETPLEGVYSAATFVQGNQLQPNDLPTLVYAFAPECEPCILATEVTLQLAAEFEGQINVLGLAYALSSDTVQYTHEYANRYRSVLRQERIDWVQSLPRNADEMAAYTEGIPELITGHVGEMSIGFPVAIDWDRMYSGTVGMGIAPLPCWAFVGRDGNLREVVPGRYEIVNRDGEFIESTLPAIEALREMVEEMLLRGGME